MASTPPAMLAFCGPRPHPISTPERAPKRKAVPCFQQNAPTSIGQNSVRWPWNFLLSAHRLASRHLLPVLPAVALCGGEGHAGYCTRPAVSPENQLEDLLRNLRQLYGAMAVASNPEAGQRTAAASGHEHLLAIFDTSDLVVTSPAPSHQPPPSSDKPAPHTQLVNQPFDAPSVRRPQQTPPANAANSSTSLRRVLCYPVSLCL
ncbi:hypothetical protein K458DRAFT_384598 [Lentithecium fluviatile CBS 122367]|uniref:Uncharacterized protein n=1 Tax=Lentithecium fluviatile CBS 122367 TaxID=1168545 RepID=A0A6G1JD05_9PLEO|nr:hypothetical protein K458DRAFT_384598 [Lentithecium fluviatile CBS 122367]